MLAVGRRVAVHIHSAQSKGASEIGEHGDLGRSVGRTDGRQSGDCLVSGGFLKAAKQDEWAEETRRDVTASL